VRVTSRLAGDFVGGMDRYVKIELFQNRFRKLSLIGYYGEVYVYTRY